MHFRYMLRLGQFDRLEAYFGQLLQDGQHALGQVEVVQAPVAIRQHGTHMAVEGAQHAPLFLALQPGVHVAVEQCRLAFTHALEVGIRNLQLVRQLAARQRV
jgi:hypothetical protein